MGTTYAIYEDEKAAFELDEMSNTLSLCMGNEDSVIQTRRLAPDQVIQIALEMLKVCSYWTEEGTVEKSIEAFKAKEYSW